MSQISLKRLNQLFWLTLMINIIVNVFAWSEKNGLVLGNDSKKWESSLTVDRTLCMSDTFDQQRPAQEKAHHLFFLSAATAVSAPTAHSPTQNPFAKKWSISLVNRDMHFSLSPTIRSKWKKAFDVDFQFKRMASLIRAGHLSLPPPHTR